MKNNRVEYYFLKRSVEQFSHDLHQFESLINNKVFSDDEALEIMSGLVAVKENIESLEKVYLKRIA